MGISQQIGSSSLSKPGVCTSSTRPATPYEGQMIYETDTDKVLVWNGSAWYANWNLPFGVVGTVSSVAGNITINTGALQNVTLMTLTWTAIAGRTYKFTAVGSALKNTSTSWTKLAVTTGAGAETGIAVYASAAAGEYANLSLSGFLTGIAAGSQTYKLMSTTGSATATLIRSGSDAFQFIIEDIGPV